MDKDSKFALTLIVALFMFFAYYCGYRIGLRTATPINVTSDTTTVEMADTAPTVACERVSHDEVINITSVNGKAVISREKHPGARQLHTSYITNGDSAQIKTTNQSDTCAVDGFSLQIKTDTAMVLPVTYRIYEDSTYTLQVSGIEPRLDYIKIRKQTVVKTVYIDAPPVKPHTKPWSFGVTGGYGFCKDGISPYIGLGVQYNLIRW